MSSTPRGRRPAGSDTRAAILDAAREAFAAQGFAGTTIRGVARAAEVDPALVHHYFGTKDDLFLAALELPVDPRAEIAERVVGPAAGDPGAAGERLLRGLLSVWDDPAYTSALVATIRRVLEPGGERLFREGFLPVVLLPAGERLGVDHPEQRMPLVASQVLGLIVMRYLLRVEPLVSMSADDVVATYAPVLQRYLTGPLS